MVNKVICYLCTFEMQFRASISAVNHQGNVINAFG